MIDQYSIAKARDTLAHLVRSVETSSPVILTRRGRSVAVLMSYSDYTRLNRKQSLMQALGQFRDEHKGELDNLAEAFENTRDRSTGREVNFD